jgi:hypothetical protein
LGILMTFAGNAAALVPETPQTYTIVIYNNSTSVLYPEISKGITSAVIGPGDEWLHAEFATYFPNNMYPRFPTSYVYRAVINITKDGKAIGLLRGDNVTITVPFFSQLKEVNKGDIGRESDQFIDWFNANRLYLFEGVNAFNAADITDGVYPVSVCPPPATPKNHFCYHTPTVITPPRRAAMPTCKASTTASSCTVTIKSYLIEPPTNIPFQLQEYTFLSAEKNKTTGKAYFADGLHGEKPGNWMNYNVSSLDSVYLPVAMGTLGNSAVPYVGSTQTIDAFHKELGDFAKDGSNWPTFRPVYFSAWTNTELPPQTAGALCSFKAYNQTVGYALPKLPGAAVMLTESYAGSANPPITNPPVPPILTSNPPPTVFAKYYPDAKTSTATCLSTGVAPFSAPDLGTTGQGIVNLWDNCITKMAGGAECIDIRKVYNFFLTNYINTCGTSNTPDLPSAMRDIYGFVPITYPLSGSAKCTGGNLKDTLGASVSYPKLVETYCSLQYNYLTGAAGEEIFNPYTQLIHKTLASTAYAFSIDDGVSFKHAEGTGVVFAVGGPEGLPNTQGAPLPTKDTILRQCAGFL